MIVDQFGRPPQQNDFYGNISSKVLEEAAASLCLKAFSKPMSWFYTILDAKGNYISKFKDNPTGKITFRRYYKLHD
jgi:hypothetical protein